MIDKNVAYWGDRCCKAEAENARLRVAIQQLIDNIETGSYESTGQAVEHAKKLLAPVVITTASTEPK